MKKGESEVKFKSTLKTLRDVVNINFRGLYHKAYYGRNLRISEMSQSVCPWQAFPAKSSVCG
jgi:hypothetical protein